MTPCLVVRTWPTTQLTCRLICAFRIQRLVRMAQRFSETNAATKTFQTSWRLKWAIPEQMYLFGRSRANLVRVRFQTFSEHVNSVRTANVSCSLARKASTLSSGMSFFDSLCSRMTKFATPSVHPLRLCRVLSSRSWLTPV